MLIPYILAYSDNRVYKSGYKRYLKTNNYVLIAAVCSTTKDQMSRSKCFYRQ